MPRSLIGVRIRERRRAQGITQAALAARIGISGSYLNLIEHNRRQIGGALLKRVAEALEMPLDELDGAAGRRLLDDLGELAGDPRLAALRLDPGEIDDLAGRHPGWARALVVLQRSLLDRDRAVAALSDRLSQDPFLGDAVHNVLNQVAAIRAAAQILDSSELEQTQSERFVHIIGSESERLSDLAQALAAFFDMAHTPTRSVTPADEVDDLLADRDNHFAALEQAAGDFRTTARIAGGCREEHLVDYLRQAHAIRCETRPRQSINTLGPGQALVFAARKRLVLLADTAPATTRRFQLARVAVMQFRQGAALANEIDQARRLSSEASRRRAHDALASYLAAAVLMPYDAFLEAAEQARYDLETLTRQFDVSFEQACHRLTTLRRPGAEGIPFGLMRADPAGFVTKRLPLPHLLLPRHGTACPMWAVYEAFQNPGTIVRQIAAFPTGDRYLFVSRTVEKPRPAFGLPRRLMSVMLACDALHADRTVYGAGLDLSPGAPAVPVGSNCRLCVRRDCAYREEDPIIDA